MSSSKLIKFRVKKLIELLIRFRVLALNPLLKLENKNSLTKFLERWDKCSLPITQSANPFQCLLYEQRVESETLLRRA